MKRKKYNYLYLYLNKRNNNKFVLIKVYADGHVYYKQEMRFPNGVVNCYVGRSKKGCFSRVTRSFLYDVVYTDYDLVNVSCF